MRRVGSTWMVIVLSAAAVACHSQSSHETSARDPAPAPVTPPEPERDDAYEACRARVAEVLAAPAAPGAPELDRQRVEVLGRARGEPAIFVREPRASTPPEVSVQSQHARIRALKKRHAREPSVLRTQVLREGYVYSADPHEALALVSLLELPDLFDEPVIFQQRGEAVRELERVDGREPRYVVRGTKQKAELLLFDRVATTRSELERPLHRDLRALARETGFDRARITHLTERAAIAELRFGGRFTRAVLAAEGARLELECLDATAPERRRVEAWQQADAPRRRALAELRSSVADQLAEALPFDRPRDEETAERDGQLRPNWLWAYKNGQGWFSFEEQSYPVFDADGRPHPPQVCMDFVLDSFERASGTWFASRGEELGRKTGALDFSAFELKNRQGVLAFEKFAEERTELFEHRRFPQEERVQFRERARFFAFLRDRADEFRPGDIVAIQGVKNDGLVHQHAILIEDTDPVTGFPDALADQMKRPRRRTWEGIMAEAPLRSLLFRIRPRPNVLEKLDPERG